MRRLSYKRDMLVDEYKNRPKRAKEIVMEMKHQLEAKQIP